MMTKERNQLIQQKYGYGISKNLVSEKKEIKCNNIIKRYKKSCFDDVITDETKQHNTNWPEIPD